MSLGLQRAEVDAYRQDKAGPECGSLLPQGLATAGQSLSRLAGTVSHSVGPSPGPLAVYNVITGAGTAVFTWHFAGTSLGDHARQWEMTRGKPSIGKITVGLAAPFKL